MVVSWVKIGNAHSNPNSHANNVIVERADALKTMGLFQLPSAQTCALIRILVVGVDLRSTEIACVQFGGARAELHGMLVL